MDLLVTIIVGGVIGWLASLVLKTDGEMGTVANIVAGVIGAFLARVLFGELLGIGSANSAGELSVYGVIWGVVGSVLAIMVWRAVRRSN